MKRHIHGGHVKWIVSAMRSFYHIIPEKWFVLFWMCDFVALTRCCKLVSFLCFIHKVYLHFQTSNAFYVYEPLSLWVKWVSQSINHRRQEMPGNTCYWISPSHWPYGNPGVRNRCLLNQLGIKSTIVIIMTCFVFQCDSAVNTANSKRCNWIGDTSIR